MFNKLKANSRKTVDVDGSSAVEKRRKGLLCRSAAKVSGYRCTFQIDLVSGKVQEAPIADHTLPESWHEQIKTSAATYRLFSFGVGDPQPPKYGESIVGVGLDGAVAQQLFKAMGPDLVETCSSEDHPYRQRVRANYGVQCFYEINNKRHWCSVGLDLKTIKPEAATVC